MRTPFAAAAAAAAAAADVAADVDAVVGVLPLPSRVWRGPRGG
ncbi:hypothetical protein [Rhodococcus qingshengii]|nr:hypothetical protein [Rhodococcus qingshengii]